MSSRLSDSGAVLAAVKGGLRPPLTAAPRSARAKSGRDEEMSQARSNKEMLLTTALTAIAPYKSTGGEWSYSGRLGKVRRARESRHSSASPNGVYRHSVEGFATVLRPAADRRTEQVAKESPPVWGVARQGGGVRAPRRRRHCSAIVAKPTHRSTQRPVGRIGITTHSARFLSAGERRQYPGEIRRRSQHARAADEAEGGGAIAGGKAMEARPRQRCALVRDAPDGVKLRPAAPAGPCAGEPGAADRALVEDSRSHGARLGFRSRGRRGDRPAGARRRRGRPRRRSPDCPR